MTRGADQWLAPLLVSLIKYSSLFESTKVTDCYVRSKGISICVSELILHVFLSASLLGFFLAPLYPSPRFCAFITEKVELFSSYICVFRAPLCDDSPCFPGPPSHLMQFWGGLEKGVPLYWWVSELSMQLSEWQGTLHAHMCRKTVAHCKRLTCLFVNLEVLEQQQRQLHLTFSDGFRMHFIFIGPFLSFIYDQRCVFFPLLQKLCRTRGWNTSQ